MRFDVISLFPELVAPVLAHGVNRRAGDAGVQVHFWNPRDFADGGYRRIDDRPFGGGPGMVMLAEPLARCVDAIRSARDEQPGPSSPSPTCDGDAPEGADASVAGCAGSAASERAPVVLFSPAGRPLTHDVVSIFASAGQGAILLCGRYEGVDQRFIARYVDQQISLGDFVLSGGEPACAAFLDAVLRLLPDVLGDAQSHQQDSFHDNLSGLLDCPHYTRPEVWRGLGTPAALLSGDHARIARWRRQQSLSLSASQRPDLLQRARQAGQLSAEDVQHLGEMQTLK